MGLCQTENTILPGSCQSEGRWVGPDGKVRCSLHHVSEFGHQEALIRVENYEPPRTPEQKKPTNGRRKQAKGAKNG